MRARQVVADLTGFASVHGVIAVPALGKVFATATGDHCVAVVDAASLKTTATLGPIGYGDGLAYAPDARRVFVSVAAIDAASARIVERYPIATARRPHGLAIDPVRRLLFAADEAKAELFVLDLPSMRVLSHYPVGDEPDVLAVDPALGRVYVACESGVVDVFQVNDQNLLRVGELRLPYAHTIAVDPATHFVYLPIRNRGGRPVLEIYRPSGQPAGR